MGTMLSAGVYVREIDLSQIIPAVATSIGAIVGASTKGPIGKPVLITSTKQFIDTFGTPSPTVSFMHYCALAFLEKSSVLYVTRVAGTGYTYGGLLFQKLAAATQNVFNPLAQADYTATPWATAGGAALVTDNIGYFYARGPGSYGSTLKVGVRSKNLLAPTGVTVTPSATGGTLGSALAVSYQVAAINAQGESLPSVAVAATCAVGTTNSVTITWTLIPDAVTYEVYGRTAGTLRLMATQSTNTFVDTGAITPNAAVSPAVAGTYTDEFDIDVYDTTISATIAQESFHCALWPKLDGFNRNMELASVINSYSQLIGFNSNYLAFNGTYPTIFTSAAMAFAAGASGSAVTDSDIINGWQQYKDPETITVRILINGGYSSVAVQLAMDTLAQGRQDCVAILDMPSASQATADAMTYRVSTLNLNSNRSALYTPDVKINDPYNDLIFYLPPSGHVAAVYANTDYVANAWFAPAGLNRGTLNVLGLRWIYNQGSRDMLAPLQINYIRNFPGLGIAVWEQRTLQTKSSALSFVNVRRLMDVIEVSIAKALLYSNFEPNDTLLRMQLVSMVAEFLELVKRGRGLNNYLVVCDDSNNPASSVAKGELHIDVYIEPTLPAEKIQLVAVVTKQGANFKELVNRGVTA